MGKVILSGVSKGMTAPVNYKANFVDNTWEQIIDACQKNKVPDTWLVADQKTMTINGTDYLIDIIGKNHDAYSDGSGIAPLTFQLHDCYDTEYAMNNSNTNSGGWASCKMRTTHLPSILSSMPTEIQTGIKEVDKITSIGGSGSALETTNDKLFLLSEVEVCGTALYSFEGEGTQYEYYSAGNSKIKKCNGSDYFWYLRSPYSSNSSGYACIGRLGSADKYGTPSAGLGVSFAFCF